MFIFAMRKCSSLKGKQQKAFPIQRKFEIKIDFIRGMSVFIYIYISQVVCRINHNAFYVLGWHEPFILLNFTDSFTIGKKTQES